MSSLRFVPSDESWEILGEVRGYNDSGNLILAFDELDQIRAFELRRVLDAESRFRGQDGRVSADVSPVPRKWINHDSPISGVSFEYSSTTEIRLRIEVLLDPPDAEEDEEVYISKTYRLLNPFVASKKGRIVLIELDPRSDFPVIGYVIHLGFNTRARTLGELHKIAESIEAFLEHVSAGKVSRPILVDLIRGGQAALLIGQEENDWFEAKIDSYDLSGLKGKISLSQAVARFGNSEEGGVIVVGARTKKSSGGEVVTSVTGIPRDESVVRKYLQALEHCLYPPPESLKVEAVECGDPSRMLIVIDIPPQPEELKPFLVHGAFVDGRLEGAFISIVRRRGEGSIPVTAPMIHSTLAVGRALLRSEGARTGPQRAPASEDTDRSDSAAEPRP